jgi:transposase-like protein
MDPQTQFCHNPDCPARGVVGRGNIQIHSRAHRRYQCTAWRRTFAENRGTPFYRKRTAHDVITTVLTLLTHGCPTQAIVAAFGLDVRTVATWQRQAGQHCRSPARPSRRVVGQDGGSPGLDGPGDGRPVAALARRGPQPASQSGPDHHPGPNGPLLGLERGDPGLCRWPSQLRHRLWPRVPRSAAHRPAVGRAWQRSPAC